MTLVSSHRSWSQRLPAEFGVWDLTADIEAFVVDSEVRCGSLTIQAVGSTAAITTIEYEAGALEDLHRSLEEIAPIGANYAHNERWHDGNGFSHVRSALLKTGVALPIVEGRLALGTWQQVIVINLDNRQRDREVIGVITGSS
jgi:secondary thiamine-phosphate synthase enzyme